MSGLRIDRLVSVYLVHPLVRLRRSRAPKGIPVLMYHSVSEEPESRVRPYFRTTTHPDVFTRHMRYLHEHGYEVMNLAEAVNALETESNNIQRKRVVITFDDGFRDFYTNAFPILKKYGFTATMFVPTGFIHAGRPWKNKAVMTWDEIRELKGKGIQFGSHTVTHPKLRDIQLQDVKHELELSKAHLDRQLSDSIRIFCYPYGFPEEDKTFTRQLKKFLIDAGYHCATGTRIGTLTKGDDPYFIRRIPINSCDDLTLLRAKLDGGYDWLHWLQLSSKKIKPFFNR